MITSAAIKSKATLLGFDLCGIAPVDSYPELAYLREWLANGYAGEMAWMSRTADRRSDVREVVAGARSVIVTATMYNTDRPYADAQPPAVGRVSRYAWGDDYHDVITARLEALLSWMREQVQEPFDARPYVDTGPVQERVYAQYAGIGWIGKNTCVINAEIGSWLFLGEIITTLALEPDTQALEQCGTCTRCIDACPTGAILDAGVLDSTRCLSYTTIELRSSIPEPLRSAMGSHIYGCDVCQEVCPYNRPAPSSHDREWQPRAGLDAPLLIDLWRRSDRELKSLVKGSAMTRAKLSGLRRNIAVAIGNSGDESVIAVLDDGSDDRPSVSDAMVQEHVAWARARGTS